MPTNMHIDIHDHANIDANNILYKRYLQSYSYLCHAYNHNHNSLNPRGMLIDSNYLLQLFSSSHFTLSNTVARFK